MGIMIREIQIEQIVPAAKMVTGGEAHVEHYDEHEEGEDGDVDGQQVVQPAPGVVLAPDAHHRIGVDGRCPPLQTLAAYVAPPTSG